MDLIGNNISNVNTVGYKGQRVTFEESFAQLLAGSSKPPGGNGGTNPVQVGLGMAIGSIDTLVSQGNIQSTGQVTDLAIQGESYFPVSDGQGTFFFQKWSLPTRREW
jgi:flagellar hook protein FlgE